MRHPVKMHVENPAGVQSSMIDTTLTEVPDSLSATAIYRQAKVVNNSVKCFKTI